MDLQQRKRLLIVAACIVAFGIFSGVILTLRARSMALLAPLAVPVTETQQKPVIDQQGINTQATPAAPIEDMSRSSTVNTDTDGDGLTDDREKTLGTNLALRDTDGDGISDYDEVELRRTNPIVFDQPQNTVIAPTMIEILDSDQDGLLDMQEQESGTNVENPDTDGDGLTDGQEKNIYQTDPRKSDTDGDGYPDAQEVEKGYNPLGPGRCALLTCIP